MRKAYTAGMDFRSFIAKLVLTAFILAALFGIYGMVSFSHAEHSGCPVSSTQHSLCISPLKHLGHWQAVFTAVFAELVTLFTFIVAFFIGTAAIPTLKQATLWRYRERVPLRPTVLQELFSQGILHRKEPQIA